MLHEISVSPAPGLTPGRAFERYIITTRQLEEIIQLWKVVEEIEAGGSGNLYRGLVVPDDRSEASLGSGRALARLSGSVPVQT